MKNYSEITKIIAEDFSKSDRMLKEQIFKNQNEIDKEIYSYLSKGSKRIRSALIFLVTKSLGNKIGSKQFYLSHTVELIHNASLLHDDVIDEADKRRNESTFNKKFNNTLSIISGDYLLSLALENLLKLKSQPINELFTDTLKTLCQGEIHQQYNNGKICTIKDYIEKSYNKTGKLFDSTQKASEILCKQKNFLGDFGKNFGIAFQIRDDYNNIYNNETSTDINDGIYTAPVIFAAKDYPEITTLSKKEITEIVKKEKYQNLTKNLIYKYSNKAIENIKFLQDNKTKENIYLNTLAELCRFLEV